MDNIMTGVLTFIGGVVLGGIAAAVVLKSLNKTDATKSKTKIEVFKGELSLTAVKDYAKKTFSDDPNLIEAVLIGDLQKCDRRFSELVEQTLDANVKVSDGFKVNYLLDFAQGGILTSVTQVVSENIDSQLHNLLESNNQIVRIEK
jgi:hypothetical protein